MGQKEEPVLTGSDPIVFFSGCNFSEAFWKKNNSSTQKCEHGYLKHDTQVAYSLSPWLCNLHIAASHHDQILMTPHNVIVAKYAEN